MKHYLATGLLALCALATPVAGAHAQFYVSGSAGLAIPNDLDVTGGGTDGSISFETGPAVNLALGYKFAFGLRTEIEGGWLQTKVDKLSVGNTSVSTTASGDNIVWTGTVNAFYDIKTGTAFTPYVGGGIGVGSIDNATFTVAGVTGDTGSSTDFAWLLEAGFAYQVSPNLSIVPSYRYLQINTGRSESGITTDDFSTHILKVGVRWSF